MPKLKPEGGKPSKDSDDVKKSVAESDKKGQAAGSDKNNELVNDQGEAPAINPNEVSVKEIFNQMARINDPIKKSYIELENAKERLSLLEEAKKKARTEIAPQKRLDKRKGEKKEIEDSDKMKLRKVETKSIDIDIMLQKDTVDELQRKFNMLCGSQLNNHKYQKLQIKSESKLYVRQNKTFLLRKAEKILNTSILENRNSILELHEKSKDNSEEGLSKFNSTLRELLFSVDDEGAVLCSGTASKTMIYKAIREALLIWDTQSQTIPNLEWPEKTNS